MRALIVFSHHRWNAMQRRPQQVMSRLAGHFQVFFIEEPVVTDDDDDPSLDRRPVAPGVDVLTPRTSGAATGFDAHASVLAPMLTRWFASQGVETATLWFGTPAAWPLHGVVPSQAIVYDCAEEFSAECGTPASLCELESQLLQQADVVFAAGPTLAESKRRRHAQVVSLPSGVDARHFAPARATADVEAMRLAHEIQGRLGRPRMGYFGTIDRRLDLALVAALADGHPDWQVVMAGPLGAIDPGQLPRRKNLHWLGPQPYSLLPQLVAGWDVCLLPFRVDASTRCLSPSRTLEYMAAGKPVVSTALPDVQALYGDAVSVAEDAAQFIDHCRRELHESMFKRVARAARMHTMVSRWGWESVASRMREAIDDAVARRAQFERAFAQRAAEVVDSLLPMSDAESVVWAVREGSRQAERPAS